MHASSEDTAHHPVLTSGITVTNLRALLNGELDVAAPSGLGTLGFFAAERDRAGNGARVLVSSRHVLFAHGAALGSAVYQPEFSREGATYRFRQDELHPIAELHREGFEGHHRYRYAGDVEREYFVDGAVARLAPSHRARFVPALPGAGVHARTRIGRARRVVAADASLARGIPLYKWGRTTGLTSGRLIDARATVTSREGAERRNVIVVRADGGARFADEGDSGALLVNGRAEAVGLVWGRSDTDPSVAFACHIHPLLDRLGLTLLTHAPARPAARPPSPEARR